VYVTRFTILCAAAVICFAVFPTAPPWMASDNGHLGEVIRPVGRGWARISFPVAGTWLDEGRAAANPVAAVPSLHTAFASLVALTLWSRTRSRVLRGLLVAYPVAMAFVLVYGAEHYVVDCLAGVAFLGLAVALQQRLMARRQARATEARATDVPQTDVPQTDVAQTDVFGELEPAQAAAPDATR